MLDKNNIKRAITVMGFLPEKNKKIYTKHFAQYNCELSVDFSANRLIFPEKIKGRDRNNGFDKPENFVVFECVNRLLDKGYRPEHIELEREWPLGHDAKSGRADICVADLEGETLFIVECKTAGREFAKAFKDTCSDGGQLFSYWQQEDSTKWLVLYASSYENDTIIYDSPTINCSDDPNVILGAKKDESIKLYENANTAVKKHKIWKETYSSKWYDDLIFSADSKAYEIGIKPLYKKDLKEFSPNDKIVNKFEEILRHNNVSDKENAFNRLIALFICKLVDEITKNDNDEVEFQYKHGTDTYETLQDRLQRLHKEGMEKFMREEIYYVSADYPEWLFSTYTGHQRKKAIEDLKKTIRILKFYSNNDFSFKDVHNEELFYQNGKILVEVVQLFEKYRIVYSSKHQFLGDLFEQLLNKGFKQNEGQFFTPMPVTRFIWDCLPLDKITHTEKGTVYPKVIDYACGAGHFLTEAVEAINTFIESDGNNSWARDHIYGIEKDYRLARVAKISLYMNGAGEGNIIFGDGLENAPERQIISGSFDILVANPPYSVKDFKQHLQLKNNSFELLDAIGDSGGEIETLFIERIEQLLKPNGIAAVILPSSILSNDSASYTGAREHLLKNFKLRAIAQLGSKTFGATGTNTVILFLEKYNEPPKQKDLAEDIVNSILSDCDILDWKDREILESYIAETEVSENDYHSFIKEAAGFDKLKEIEYFSMYLDAFNADSGTQKFIKTKAFANMTSEEQTKELLKRFYQFAKAVEFDKLFCFALTYNQQTVIITAPADNAKQKEFLGYDWSNRKGNEGIQIVKPGGKMYNHSDRTAKNTLAYAVRKSFEDDYPELTEEIKPYTKVVNTSDMLDFSRLSFNKAIRTSVEKKKEIVSKYPTKPLTAVLKHITGAKTRIEKDQLLPEGAVPVITQENNKLISGYANNVEPITDLPVIVFGDHSCTFKYIDFKFVQGADNTQLLKTDEQKLMSKYLYNYLMITPIPNKDKYERHMKYLKQIEIPLPPIDIQEKIIEECQKIDNEYNTAHLNIESYKKKIEKLFDDLDAISESDGIQTVKLSAICEFNPSKAEVNISENTIISFVEMASVNENGYIETLINRPYNEVSKGSYTYFAEDDIIIAKITPCMENGKCGIAKGLTNKIGFGSSEFHVIRCNEKINNKFLFGYLNRAGIRSRAANAMTGASGHRRVPVTFYENMEIPLLDISKQNEYIEQVIHLENEISALEQHLNDMQSSKEEILKKYL